MGLQGSKVQVCGLVSGGLLAFVLGMAAYGVAGKKQDCSHYRSSLAMDLAITAGCLTLTVDLLASIAACTTCCSAGHSCSSNACAKACGIVSLVFSWIVGLPAAGLLFVGALLARISFHNLSPALPHADQCYFSKHKWVLLAGSLLSLLSSGLALACYPLITTTSSSSPSDNISALQAPYSGQQL